MMQAAHAIGLSRDVPSLLGQSGRPTLDAEAAVQAGLVWREKVEGVWLYATTDERVDAVVNRVRQHVDDTLARWFLGALHPLSGFIAKHMTETQISKDAVRVLLRRLLRQDEFDALGVLTNDFQPYLVAFRQEDRVEVDRQITHISENIDTRGQLRPEELPFPVVPRQLRVWRGLMLQHGAYLGLGRMESGVLVAWS